MAGLLAWLLVRFLPGAGPAPAPPSPAPVITGLGLLDAPEASKTDETT
jgi:hypothetical protein